MLPGAYLKVVNICYRSLLFINPFATSLNFYLVAHDIAILCHIALCHICVSPMLLPSS